MANIVVFVPFDFFLSEFLSKTNALAFGVRIFSDNALEWQINAVSKYAKKLKEKEIEHLSLTPEEKE